MDAFLHSFCSDQRKWLGLELQAESEETHGERGQAQALHHLQISGISVGLYGRTILRLITESGELLASHRFTTGDEVEIRTRNSSPGIDGVISEVSDDGISVALYDKDVISHTAGCVEILEDLPPPLSILAKSSIEVHKKLIAALDELEREGAHHKHGRIVRALLQPESQDSHGNAPTNALGVRFTPLNPELNKSQLEAIAFCLSEDNPVTLIHGPPGTGKSSTLVEVIHQAIQKGWSVLVTAPSNVAVDNILGMLSMNCQASVGKSQKRRKAKPARLVRLGHPARLQATILPFSLENLVHSAEGTQVVRDVRKELQGYLSTASSMKSRDKCLVRKEISVLRKEIREREEKVVNEVISTAQVVLATCVGAANRLLRDKEFDLVIIDEAAQALEAACWIPALLCKTKIILAGDHLQLPPTVKSRLVQAELGRSMFERMIAMDERLSHVLRVQYRMHEQIADWASDAVYGGLLQTHERARGRTLKELVVAQGEQPSDDPTVGPMLLIDTAGCEMFDSTTSAGSRFNSGEAEIVCQHVTKLLSLGLRQHQIAVITPYNGQVDLLRIMMRSRYPKLEIKSVDGFQGGEREAVILSLVRSSPRGGIEGIGFVRDHRRLNVAITRCRRHCCIVCDSESVGQSKFIQSLLEWINAKGESTTALEYGANTRGIFSGGRPEQAMACKALATVKGPSAEKVSKFPSRTASKAMPPNTGLAGNVQARPAKISLPYSKKAELDRQNLMGANSLGDSSTPCESGPANIKPTAHLSRMIDSSTCPLTPSNVAGAMVSLVAVETQTTLSSSLLNCVSNDEINDRCAVAEDTATKNAAFNQVLGGLARKRQERTHRINDPPRSKAASKGAHPNKLDAPRNRRLGSLSHKARASQEDDMSFLERQIQKNQNAHGRKLTGQGNYLTTLNGILTTPTIEAEQHQRDPRLVAAIQAKLRLAEHKRRAKTPKK